MIHIIYIPFILHTYLYYIHVSKTNSLVNDVFYIHLSNDTMLNRFCVSNLVLFIRYYELHRWSDVTGTLRRQMPKLKK